MLDKISNHDKLSSYIPLLNQILSGEISSKNIGKQKDVGAKSALIIDLLEGVLPQESVRQARIDAEKSLDEKLSDEKFLNSVVTR